MTRLPFWAAAVSLFAYVPTASACQWCRSSVDATIYGDDFWTNVGIAVLPFLVIAVVVVAVERLSSSTASARRSGSTPPTVHRGEK